MELKHRSRRTLAKNLLCAVGMSLVLVSAIGRQIVSAASNVAKTGPEKAEIDLGTKEFDKGRYAQAVKHFTTAMKQAPRNPDPYLLRGRSYDRLGATAKAIQDLSRYVEERPSDPAGYVARGDAKNFAGKHEEALADYNAAIKLAPSSAEAYMGRGLALAGLERYNEAIKDYQWVLVRQPSNKEVLANLGVACVLARRPFEAVQYLERALKQEADPKWRQRINHWLDTVAQNPRAGEMRPRGPTKNPLW